MFVYIRSAVFRACLIASEIAPMGSGVNSPLDCNSVGRVLIDFICGRAVP